MTRGVGGWEATGKKGLRPRCADQNQQMLADLIFAFCLKLFKHAK